MDILKLVYEDLNSFVRNQDPKTALNLGYEAKIRDFFRQYDVPDYKYKIKENKEIIFSGSLNLPNSNITKLPDNLIIGNNLWIYNNPIKELPNNLYVAADLHIEDTLITELPEDLDIGYYIFVHTHQTQLIDFLKNSKYKKRYVVHDLNY